MATTDTLIYRALTRRVASQPTGLRVVYPEEVWYTYVDEKDIDEIIDEHLVNGRIVERLRI